MKESKYPLHPGQTHVEPYFCTIPLEEYENLKKRIKQLENELADANKLIKELLKMRMQAKVGDTLRIIEMKGEPKYSGKIGTVEHIDDIGQIHGTWGGCAIQPEHDRYEILQHA